MTAPQPPALAEMRGRAEAVGPDPLVKRIALAWLHHQGYTDAEIAKGEASTHQNSGCEWSYPNWNCTDEDGRSLHPELDALYDAEEMAVFVVELLQPDLDQAARDAALVGLVMAEARAVAKYEGVMRSPTGMFKMADFRAASSEWNRANQATREAVRARIEQEDQA